MPTEIEILPGKIRQVILTHDEPWVFSGFIQAHESCRIVYARLEGRPVEIKEIPPGIDRHAEEWATIAQRVEAGQSLVLFVKNIGERPVSYRLPTR